MIVNIAIISLAIVPMAMINAFPQATTTSAPGPSTTPEPVQGCYLVPQSVITPSVTITGHPEPQPNHQSCNDFCIKSTTQSLQLSWYSLNANSATNATLYTCQCATNDFVASLTSENGCIPCTDPASSINECGVPASTTQAGSEYAFFVKVDEGKAVESTTTSTQGSKSTQSASSTSTPTGDSNTQPESVPANDANGANKIPLWNWVLYGVAGVSVVIVLVLIVFAKIRDAKRDAEKKKMEGGKA
ncbi:hypothetical protein HDU76_000091 [Blyttiomyces sp. JEL0837]|nr:hypothetical protein HDU76_000091 [Blyttiomyces sp. JEL0837]